MRYRKIEKAVSLLTCYENHKSFLVGNDWFMLSSPTLMYCVLALFNKNIHFSLFFLVLNYYFFSLLDDMRGIARHDLLLTAGWWRSYRWRHCDVSANRYRVCRLRLMWRANTSHTGYYLVNTFQTTTFSIPFPFVIFCPLFCSFLP